MNGDGYVPPSDEREAALGRFSRGCWSPRCAWPMGIAMISDALADWAHKLVDPEFFPPGMPRNNGYVESFYSRKRDEFLNMNPTDSQSDRIGSRGQVSRIE